MWDDIASTNHWDLFHAMDTAVEGWLILGLRRHAETIADLSDAESLELGGAVRDVSLALRQAVGAAKTYLAQFAEQPGHHHVHMHVVARPGDLDPANRGPGIFSLLNADENEQVSAHRKNEIALSVQSVLVKSGTTVNWHVRELK